MKTRLPISTISYNTEEFLKLKLNELIRSRIISYWFFIEHQAEDDEKKNHKHLYVMPAKTIQTDDLCDELIELTEDITKPLRCLHWQTSKFSDWFLYSIHEETYLMRKGKVRKYHYKKDDIVCSDVDQLEYLISEIDMTDYSGLSRVIKAQRAGLSFADYMMSGCVPVQLFNQYLNAWQYLASQKVETYEVDTDTGEIVN